MKRLRTLLGVLALALAGVLAQTATATGPYVVPVLTATDVTTCNGFTDVTLQLNATDPPPSLAPLDLEMVFDESGSVVPSSWTTMRTQASQFVTATGLSPTGLNVGAMKFGGTVSGGGSFETVSPLSSITGSVATAIFNMVQFGGNTAIGAALQQAQAVVTAGRPGVKKAIILETDGVNNGTLNPVTAANAVRAAGIELYVVGVGGGTDPAQLLALAGGDPSKVVLANNYTELQAIFTSIATQLAPAGSNLSYTMTPAAGWSYVPGSATATTGTATATAGGFAWSAPTLHTGSATIHYRLHHDGTTNGTFTPHAVALLSWNDGGASPPVNDSFASTPVQVSGCNEPPHADAGAPQSVDLSGSHTADVTLDGSGSTDDGQLGPLSYSWSEGGTPLGTGEHLTTPLGLGHHVLTLTVFDGEYTDTATTTVDVRDPSPPLIVQAISGTLGNNGWYVSDVTVTYTVTDDESDVTASPGCAGGTVSVDTPAQSFSCEASSAGGTAVPQSTTIKRDATQPAIVFAGNAGSYGVADMVNITCTASDAMSGLASPANCGSVSAAAWTLAPGPHTLSVSATDNAGNTRSDSTIYTIVVRAADICTLIRQWTDNAGVANSLCVKVDHGSSTAFANEANAQDGKHLLAGKAAVLIALQAAL